MSRLIRSTPEEDDYGQFTKGRVVLPFGVLRVSSNMVAGALMQVCCDSYSIEVHVKVRHCHSSYDIDVTGLLQGFKVVIRDIGLHISNREMDYIGEDSGLCLGALHHDGGQGVNITGSKAELSSVQEYLENSFFVQVTVIKSLL